MYARVQFADDNRAPAFNYLCACAGPQSYAPVHITVIGMEGRLNGSFPYHECGIPRLAQLAGQGLFGSSPHLPRLAFTRELMDWALHLQMRAHVSA